jgi:hypothetical protein
MPQDGSRDKKVAPLRKPGFQGPFLDGSEGVISMADQLPTSATHTNKRLVVALVSVGGLVISGLVGGWVYLRFSGHDMAGLDGTWRDNNNPKHSYEFQANGDLTTWYGSKEWWNKIGWSATWRRTGNQITIRTDRNWDFEGTLDGATIRGKMLIRDEHNAIVNTPDVIWQKE